MFEDEMQVVISRKKRPKGRRPVWSLQIRRNGMLVFSDRWVAVKFMTPVAASIVSTAIILNERDSSGLEHRHFRPSSAWKSNESGSRRYMDSHGYRWLLIHMDGPRNGGDWFLQAQEGGQRRFALGMYRTDSFRIWIKTPLRGQWLAELFSPVLHEVENAV